MRTLQLIFCVLLLCFVAPGNYAWSWWFNQSNEEILQKALSSTNPRTVEKCLDKLIQREQYSGILQIKHYVQAMIRAERNNLIQQGKSIDPAATRKRLAPWVKIENKASQFFKRTNVQQDGNDHSVQ
jgi:hypothetical protein